MFVSDVWNAQIGQGGAEVGGEPSLFSKQNRNSDVGVVGGTKPQKSSALQFLCHSIPAHQDKQTNRSRFQNEPFFAPVQIRASAKVSQNLKTK